MTTLGLSVNVDPIQGVDQLRVLILSKDESTQGIDYHGKSKTKTVSERRSRHGRRFGAFALITSRGS